VQDSSESAGGSLIVTYEDCSRESLEWTIEAVVLAHVVHSIWYRIISQVHLLLFFVCLT